MSSHPIIEVQAITRSFRSPKKSAASSGFLGQTKSALSLLFKPEFQEHQALSEVNFTIESGSFVGLIGANGAGKTTLLKILSGLIAPTSGQARVLGYDPFTRPLDFRKKIALVMGQKAQLWWDLPALDAFDLLRAIYEIPEKTYRERLNTLAELLDVQKHLQTQIRRLSLGERMKMELIGALLHWPSVIFLDEPTIGLDVLAAHKLREFLRVFNQREKATIILTSHNMDDIEKLCSRVLILRSGKMIFDGSPKGLTEQGGCRLRVRLLEKVELKELAALTGVSIENIYLEESLESEVPEDQEGAEDDHNTVTFAIQYDRIVSVLGGLMKKFQIVNMGIEQQSLERVIQRIYQDSQEEEKSK